MSHSKTLIVLFAIVHHLDIATESYDCSVVFGVWAFEAEFPEVILAACRREDLPVDVFVIIEGCNDGWVIHKEGIGDADCKDCQYDFESIVQFDSTIRNSK